jgi:hypothetical protein
LAGVTFAAALGALDPAGAAARLSRHRADEARKAQAEHAPKGPLLVVVSIGDQRVSLFGDGALIARGAVSTGMNGHPTPEGVFTVIQKDRYHRSNIYSGAPMPLMQRITWSGVALHAGVLPGYPASHGCIRMTYEFAAMLWRITQVGVRVVVTQKSIEPVEIAHPALFAPKPAEPPVASSRTSAMVTTDVKVAASTGDSTATDAIVTTPTDAAAGPRPAAAPQQVPAAAPQEAPKPADAVREADPPRAADAPDSDQAPKNAEMPTQPDAPRAAETPKIVDPAQVIALAKVEFGALPIAVVPPRKKEQVSAFVSRKEGRLFVRQNYLPLFSVPVTIRDPEQPLGTHVFTAMEQKDGSAAMRWTVVSIPGRSISRAEEREPARRKSRRRAEEDMRARKPVREPPVAHTAATALDRIDMPKEAVDRISELVAPGFAFIVSDLPISGETEDGETDFIVLTR